MGTRFLSANHDLEREKKKTGGPEGDLTLGRRQNLRLTLLANLQNMRCRGEGKPHDRHSRKTNEHFVRCGKARTKREGQERRLGKKGAAEPTTIGSNSRRRVEKGQEGKGEKQRGKKASSFVHRSQFREKKEGENIERGGK